MDTVQLTDIQFDSRGLVPAVVQEGRSGKVLMVAYMNAESLQKTVESGETWFYSRSRQELWHKGETSGHFQKVRDIFVDCDADTLLVVVDQIGLPYGQQVVLLPPPRRLGRDVYGQPGRAVRFAR